MNSQPKFVGHYAYQERLSYLMRLNIESIDRSLPYIVVRHDKHDGKPHHYSYRTLLLAARENPGLIEDLRHQREMPASAFEQTRYLCVNIHSLENRARKTKKEREDPAGLALKFVN